MFWLQATMLVSDPARKVRFGIKKVRFMVKNLQAFRTYALDAF